MRIKGESGSIETLVKFVRTAIEQEIPLHYRLRLENEDLYVDQDVVSDRFLLTLNYFYQRLKCQK